MNLQQYGNIEVKLLLMTLLLMTLICSSILFRSTNAKSKDLTLFPQVRFLYVTELSTASHAVRRAKERLNEDSGFRR